MPEASAWVYLLLAIALVGLVIKWSGSTKVVKALLKSGAFQYLTSHSILSQTNINS